MNVKVGALVSLTVGLIVALVLLPIIFISVGGSLTRETTVPWFADNGIDQPMNYINSPAAVNFGGDTYFTWQGTVDFLPYIKRFNHTTDQWSETYQVASSNPISGDGHGAPAIGITPDKKIHVFYGAHESPLLYAQGNTTTFGIFVTKPNVTADATYPHVNIVGTKIYMMYRAGGLCAAYALRISTDSGATWGSEGNFLDADNHAYVGPMEVVGTKIYFQWSKLTVCAVNPERSGSWAAYYETADNGLYCNTAQRVGFLLTQALANAFCRIETPPTYSNFGTIHSVSGTVYSQYLTGNAWPTGNWNYRFGKLTGIGAPVYLTKKTDCYALRSDIGHAASRGCDGNTATDWQDSNVLFPPSWIATNLTSEKVLHHVSINFPAFPGIAGGTIQYLDTDGAWVSDGTFTLANCNSGSPENVTATLTIPARTTAYRLLFTADGCASYVTLLESWAFGGSTEWDVTTIAPTDHFQDYADFRPASTSSISSFLVSNATDGSGSKEGGNLERWFFNGTSWSHPETILTMNQTGGRLLSAPFVPTNSNAEAQIVFDERVITLSTATQKMYAWGSGGFLGTTTTVQQFDYATAALIGILSLLAVIAIIVAVVSYIEEWW